MSKTCSQCQKAYKGFGATCADCRRAPSESTGAAPPKKGSTAPADHCHECGKRVYAMEAKHVEGLLFHKTCFKCTTCKCKLDCTFGRNELGFFCLTHFHEIAKLTGGYKTGTGPTRNAVAAGLVDALVNRSAAQGQSAPEGASSVVDSDETAQASEIMTARAALRSTKVASPSKESEQNTAKESLEVATNPEVQGSLEGATKSGDDAALPLAEGTPGAAISAEEEAGAQQVEGQACVAEAIPEDTGAHDASPHGLITEGLPMEGAQKSLIADEQQSEDAVPRVAEGCLIAEH